MTVEESLFAAIRTRQYIRISYIGDQGLPRVDVIEAYTLGYDGLKQKILKGFRWASDPGFSFSMGRLIYKTERITNVELTGKAFDRPQDEIGAKGSSEFTEIICDYHFSA